MLRQPSLKPQDLVVVLKLVAAKDNFTISALAQQVFFSASEVHGCIQRLGRSHLLYKNEEGLQIVKDSLLEFLMHGVRYAFPGLLGATTSGVLTATSASPMREMMIETNEAAFVWPSPDGSARGLALTPLYPRVPEAAIADANLYHLLVLVDAIRIGSSRERAVASNLLRERLS